MIVFTGTCIMTGQRYLETIDILNDIIRSKKESIEVILSGCLANGVKFRHIREAEELLSKTSIVPSDKIIAYVLKKIHFELDTEEELFLKLPFRWNDNYFYISIVRVV